MTKLSHTFKNRSGLLAAAIVTTTTLAAVPAWAGVASETAYVLNTF